MFIRNVFLILSLVLFLIGLLLIIDLQINIVGAIIGIPILASSGIFFLGIFLILLSTILFLAGEDDLEERIRVTSHIDKNPSLVRLAIQATKNQAIQREMNHLIKELTKGNLEAGLGIPGHVEGTDIFYLRGRRGARLFYRKTRYGYDIVGKADGTGKKDNEQQVISKLGEVYHS